MRDPAEITKKCAASIAKWRIGEMLAELERTSGTFDLQATLRKVALKTAVAPGGGIDEIADVLYGMGLKLTIDKNNPVHQKWIEGGAIILEEE